MPQSFMATWLLVDCAALMGGFVDEKESFVLFCFVHHVCQTMAMELDQSCS